MPAPRNRRTAADQMARDVAQAIGREVLLARTSAGLTQRGAARLAGVSPTTQRSIELGRPGVRINSMCRVATAVGLKVWGRAFPSGTPSLRDTGQLELAERLRSLAHDSFRVAIELGLGNGRAIDLVIFGATEIIMIEIERLMADFQAQYRAADAKRLELAQAHQRPVRLVLAVEDTRRNRAAMRAHEGLIQSSLPAGSRQVLRAIRAGSELGSDGLLWMRRSVA